MHLPQGRPSEADTEFVLLGTQATVLTEEQMRHYEVAPYQRIVGCGLPMATVDVQCVEVRVRPPLPRSSARLCCVVLCCAC